jgi:hypothetical protein
VSGHGPTQPRQGPTGSRVTWVKCKSVPTHLYPSPSRREDGGGPQNRRDANPVSADLARHRDDDPSPGSPASGSALVRRDPCPNRIGGKPQTAPSSGVCLIPHSWMVKYNAADEQPVGRPAAVDEAAARPLSHWVEGFTRGREWANIWGELCPPGQLPTVPGRCRTLAVSGYA